MADVIEQVLASGQPPLQMEYRRIESSGKQLLGLRSVLRVNSLEQGVLFPEQYRQIANRNAQGIRLATWALRRLVADMAAMKDKNRLPAFVSVYIPAKMLSRDTLEKLLISLRGEMSDSELLARVRLEFSADLLLEDTEMVAAKLTTLREQYGVTAMLSEYGDSFCPVLRLCGLPMTQVILDVPTCVGDAPNSVAVRTAIGLIRSLRMSPLAEESAYVGSEEGLALALTAGCEGVAAAHGLTLDEVLE